MDGTSHLLQEIERFLQCSKWSPSRFGRAAVKDQHLLRRLRSGKTVTLYTRDKILKFIAEQRRLMAKQSRCAA